MPPQTSQPSRPKSTLKPPRNAVAPRIIRHANPFQRLSTHTVMAFPDGVTGSQSRPQRVLASNAPPPQIASNEPPPAKRPKIDSRDDPPSRPPDPSTSPTNPPKKKRAQGASVMMQEFQQSMPALLSALLAHDAGPQDLRCHSCGDTQSLIRCYDCFQAPLLCSKCQVRSHLHAPFHRLEMWNSLFFEKTSLGQIGLVLALGHYGAGCPNVPHNYRPRPFTVVHTNGVHQLPIHFCHCFRHVPHTEQLIAAGLFPSTLEQVETAFTFDVLDNAHLHTLCSKKGMYDYFAAVRRLTDNVFPGRVPDRYREFLRTMRVWRHLTMTKRSGQGHGIDAILAHRRPGSMAVWCPSCPEDGFNMAPDWTSTPEGLRHIHTWQISADGQFSLQKKKKVDDPDDIALAAGRAYFVENEAFKEYVGQAPLSQEKSTCNNLSVVNTQNTAKFKNAEITGIVGFVCARHGMFLPNGMVDLQKGERYANVDYALAHVLEDRAAQKWIQMTYDIWCQYHIHLGRRFLENFPEQAPTVERITGCVPKLHLIGHSEKCQYQYSLNYTPHSGRTHGEIVESGWAESKLAGPMTREMNGGHRHDTLDDFHGDFNWQKITKRISALYASYTNSRSKASEFAAAFDNMTVDPRLIAEWETWSLEPTIQGGEVRSVYRPRVTKVISQGRAFQSLSAQELEHSPDSTACGEALFLSKALKIESAQRHLLTHLKDDSAAHSSETLRLRQQLSREIDTWRQEQARRFPLLEERMCDHGYATPETEALLLPSDFSVAERVALGIEDIADKERTIRSGQANDALAKLRLSIKESYLSIDFKRKNVRGQKDNTRAQMALKNLAAKKHKYACIYRHARTAMIALGMQEDDAYYRPLHDTELWMKRLDQAHTLGEGQQAEPWFWSMGPTSLSEEERAEWDLEAERVQWFRARANRDRWQEELEIVEEEYRRTYRAWTKMAGVWRQLAQPLPEDGSPRSAGEAAYAYKTAAMYDKLATACQQSYERATGNLMEPGGTHGC